MHQVLSKRTIFVDNIKYEVIGLEKQGRKYFFITTSQARIEKKQITCYQIFCVGCDRLKESTKFFNAFLYTKNWLCQSCNKTGEKNPFYGKKWSENVNQDWLRDYRKSRSEKYFGNKNPMYGKQIQEIWKEKYSQEEFEKIKSDYSKRMSDSCAGVKNGFYGKTHSKESIEKANKSRKDWHDKNQKFLIIEKYEKFGLTKEKIFSLLEGYSKNSKFGYGVADLKKDCGIDVRTFKKLVVYHEIKSKKEIKDIFLLGKYEKVISAPELKLFQMCIDEFGKDNVKSQFQLLGRVFDILVGDKLLVEYDGYYFHQEKSDGRTDRIKDQIAMNNGFHLVRIKEDKFRKVDFEKAVQQIKEAYEKI
jgi:very-short-patch-repair endonuclease